MARRGNTFQIWSQSLSLSLYFKLTRPELPNQIKTRHKNPNSFDPVCWLGELTRFFVNWIKSLSPPPTTLPLSPNFSFLSCNITEFFFHVYYFSSTTFPSLPSFKRTFTKNIFFIKWQKTLIPLLSILLFS